MVPCQVIFNVCQFYMVHDYRSCASHALGPCLSVWHMVVNQSISNRLINKNFQADKSRNRNYIRVREGYSFYNSACISIIQCECVLPCWTPTELVFLLVLMLDSHIACISSCVIVFPCWTPTELKLSVIGYDCMKR